MDHIEDYSYDRYMEETSRLFNEDDISGKAESMEPARRFSLRHGEPLPYPGYTIITPPYGEDKINSDCYKRLINIGKMVKAIDISGRWLVATPEPSFHMTIAGVVSGKNYHDTIKRTERDNELVDKLANIMNNIPPGATTRMLFKGMSLFGTAVVAVFEPKTMHDYEPVKKFRERIFSNPELNEMGVKRKYPSIFHITLAYIENFLDECACYKLTKGLMAINKWIGNKNLRIGFRVESAELRYYDDFSRFSRKLDWPVYYFGDR